MSSVFKEKTWGKEESGVHIVDGFTFRGKKAFEKVIENFKDLFKKGVQSEINDFDFKVLDSRPNGAALEIEIEMVDKGNRGIAVVRLFGPNTKKENVM